MNRISKLIFYSCLLSTGFFQACSTAYPEPVWDYSPTLVTGEKAAATSNIEMDVYLDATTSMEGFAVSATSVYSQFLDQLEASALSAWKDAAIHYYKFGEIIKPVNRAEFLSAKTDLAFYRENGVFRKTYIDSVVKRTNANRLSVLVSDLFQDEGDVNIMVDQFKSKCFANGVSVGIAAIQTGFSGKVFDVRGIPSYTLEATDRPFYAIIFGNLQNMELLFDALKTKSFVKDDQFLIISNQVIRNYQTNLVKTRESISLTNKKARKEVPHSFDFGMKADGKEGKLALTLELEPNPHCADFSEDKLDLVVYRKSATGPGTGKDSSISTDIQLSDVKRAGNKITAILTLSNTADKGNYSYKLLLRVKPLGGFKTPEWVSSLSTEAPVPGTPSASKTYNLEKLCSTLLVANSSVTPACIAQFFINIYKR